MFSLIKTWKYNFLIDSIAIFFWDEDYDLVLKHLPAPSFTREPHAVYANIFRILTLKSLGDDEWKNEYGYLLSEKFLDVFQEDDRQYLRDFLQNHLSGSIDVVPRPKIDFSKVLKRTKKYFPINKHEN